MNEILNSSLQSYSMNQKSIQDRLIQNVNIQDLFIKSNDTIKKYNKNYNYNFWVPPFEIDEGIDWDLVEDANYTQSSQQVGQIYEIIVAINESDPLKNDNNSIYRIHLRILDGRTRYFDSKKKNIKWKVKYIKIRDFPQFIFIWSHFNSKKGGNFLDEKNKFAQLSKYMYDKMGIDRTEVARNIIKAYGDNHPFSTRKLYRLIPSEVLRNFQSDESKKGNKSSIEEKKISKKQGTINSLKQEIDDKFRIIIELEEEKKEMEVKLKRWEELKPFLTTPQDVKLPSGFIVKVRFDLEKKEIKFDE